MEQGAPATGEISQATQHTLEKEREARSPLERTKRALVSAKEFINQNKDVFNDKKQIMDLALNCYQDVGSKQEITAETSQGLKAIVEAMDILAPHVPATEELPKVYDQMTEFMRVRYGEGESGRDYTLPEWRKKLAEATDEERQKMEQQGLYGYAYPDQQEAKPDLSQNPEQAVNNLLREEINRLQAESQAAKDKGEKIPAKTQELLVALQLAEKADGEWAVLLKDQALHLLQSDDPEKGALERSALLPKVQEARSAFQQIISQLPAGTRSAVEGQLAQKGITGFIAGGGLNELGNIDGLGNIGSRFYQNQEDLSGLLNSLNIDEETKKSIQAIGVLKGLGVAALLLLLLPVVAISAMEKGVK